MPRKVIADSVHPESLQLQPKYKFLSIQTTEKLHAIHFEVYGVFKRGMDLVFAVALLVFLSPLFLVTAVAVKIDSPGPVFFRQKRTGRGGREFEILKFRSMVAGNDVMDVFCADRYTRVGKFIRRTSTDELPQLLNVLLGQMSFVGPRPWVPEYFANMNAQERRRTRVRPGITGLAQVKGRNGISIFQKIGYDLEYVENYSLWQDVKVAMLTVKTVLTGESVDAGKGGVQDDIAALGKENRVVN